MRISPVGVGVIGVVAGLVAGALIGAILLAGGGASTPAPAAGAASRTPTPAPTKKQEPLPTETAAWDPCVRPGLCAFIDTLDRRLAAKNLDGVMTMITFDPRQCGTSDTQLNEGIFPVECRDWPYADAIPTAGYATRESVGHPVSRWTMRDTLDGFISGTESDCSGKTDKIEKIERRVRLAILPPQPTLYWNGEVSLLIGAPLSCFPTFDPKSGRRDAFNLRQDRAGEWKIESIVEVAYNTNCESSYYHFSGDIRYYPFTDGVPAITGSPVCPSKTGG